MRQKINIPANFRRITLIFLVVAFLSSACTSLSNNRPLDETPILITNTPVISAGIGILGDSTSDEYQADDARGGEFGKTTLNWMEQLVKNRDLNFGQWGTWDEPRRTGYEYNWARSGATIRSMITSGQHTGLAQQVADGKVSIVFIWIGNNDFHLKNGSYEEIYNGTLSDAELQEKIDGMASDIETAMDTILQAGDVKMGIVTIADQGIAPLAHVLFPDTRKRRRVTEAIASLNAKIAELAEARGVLVLDSNAVGKSLFARVDITGHIKIAGQKIFVLKKGNDPHSLQLADDSGHAGTVLSGMIANSIFIDPFDTAFGLDIPPLTDEEIVQNAGMK